MVASKSSIAVRPAHRERAVLDGVLDLDLLSAAVLDQGEQHLADRDLDVFDLVDCEAGHRGDPAGRQPQDARECGIGRQPNDDRSDSVGLSHGCCSIENCSVVPVISSRRRTSEPTPRRTTVASRVVRSTAGAEQAAQTR